MQKKKKKSTENSTSFRMIEKLNGQKHVQRRLGGWGLYMTETREITHIPSSHKEKKS